MTLDTNVPLFLSSQLLQQQRCWLFGGCSCNNGVVVVWQRLLSLFGTLVTAAEAAALELGHFLTLFSR